ncbi:MAG: diaminopimelate epimerase [Terrimicrobiaceae bacterium]
MELSFTKMNGAGNDFVVLDNRAGSLDLGRDQIALLCDRHRGVGADGLLVVEPAVDGGDYRMRYYNADGGEAEMCGNGARCFARFARQLGGHGDSLAFETPAGLISAAFEGDEVALLMSEPKDAAGPVPIEAAGSTWEVHSLNTGVPHAVVFVENLDAIDVVGAGRALRFHPAFAPSGTNVNFVRVEAPGHLRIRTYERGVEGETLACGTGVTAAALIHAQLSGVSSPVSVLVAGGDTLRVRFGGPEGVILVGPADFVFDGRISL